MLLWVPRVTWADMEKTAHLEAESCSVTGHVVTSTVQESHSKYSSWKDRESEHIQVYLS